MQPPYPSLPSQGAARSAARRWICSSISNGVEAGNHALKIMSTGGVYLGGGIAPKILERLQQPAVLRGFWSKGRMEPLLRDMPVKVILNDRTA